MKKERPAKADLNLTKKPIKTLIAWAQKNGPAAFPLALGCCSYINHIRHVGMDVVYSPRHADVLVVSGALSYKAAPVVRQIYEQMPAPKYVMAIGSCACNGCLYANSYSVVSDISEIIPVDVYVPGCPPSLDDFAKAMTILKKRMVERVMQGV